ncbi:phage tail spike protein [Pediococcus sp. M21F004]|uniref:phage tail spike protein n=1 Tax=Pediococcus sp. M21F004 TaxID=3390033 RepID=UPI003DA71BD4
MYVILDKNLNRVGMLTVSGGFGTCPFWGDSVEVQIADQSNSPTLDDQSESFNTVDPNANTKNWNHTLSSIYVPYGYPETEEIVQGAHLAYKDKTNNHWYVMRLTDIKDVIDASGTHYKSCVGVNLAIWDLIHTKLDDLKAPMASCEDAFRALLAKTSWTIGTVEETGGTASITFSKSENAQAKLQALCQTYDCEIDAYMEFDSAGQPTTKTFDIVHELGVDDGVPVTYGDELVSMERVSTDENLFTRLYPYNSNGDGIEDVNNGVPYVENVEANDEYNTRIVGVDGPKFLEGSITSKSIENHSALRDWAKGILAKFDHPRINYSIQISSNFQAGLGDHIRIKDMEMLPKAAVDARVIQKTVSQADPTQNQVIVGEFATVNVITPNLIARLQNQINSRMQNLINDIKDGKKVAVIHLVTPTGANWTMAEDSKTVIAKVFVDSTNLNAYLSPSAFIWQKTDPITGVHDTAWEDKHVNDGAQITLDDGDVGTITCKIDGEFLKAEAEIVIEENYTQVWSYNFKNSFKDPWGEGIYKAPQYVHIDNDNGFMIFSSGYDNDAASTKQRGPTSDTKYHRFKLDGTYMDSMVLQGGGHGSSFGYRFVDGMPEIWTTIQTKSDGDFLGRVKYQPNTVVKLGDKSVINMCKLKNFKRISVDFEHGWVLAVAASNGAVEVTSMDNVKARKWTPTYKFNTSDYDFKQWNGDYVDGDHELQSNDIYFPYVFLNAGHYNNRDKRLSICVNVVTESLVFRHTDTPKMLPDGLIVDPVTDASMPFEPETIAYYPNNGSPYLLQGFDYHRTNDTGSGTSDSLATLWKTDLIMRDDSGDVTDIDETANDDTADGADSVDEGGET